LFPSASLDPYPLKLYAEPLGSFLTHVPPTPSADCFTLFHISADPPDLSAQRPHSSHLPLTSAKLFAGAPDLLRVAFHISAPSFPPFPRSARAPHFRPAALREQRHHQPSSNPACSHLAPCFVISASTRSTDNKPNTSQAACSHLAPSLRQSWGGDSP
jgi:hypothetical protein